MADIVTLNHSGNSWLWKLRLREYREDNNLTQLEMAECLGIPLEIYVEYETSSQKVHPEHLKSIIAALDSESWRKKSI
ncbi:MAG: helix-turn-helix transcriptional regulator [Filomicrobium sp.]